MPDLYEIPDDPYELEDWFEALQRARRRYRAEILVWGEGVN